MYTSQPKHKYKCENNKYYRYYNNPTTYVSVNHDTNIPCPIEFNLAKVSTFINCNKNKI